MPLNAAGGPKGPLARGRCGIPTSHRPVDGFPQHPDDRMTQIAQRPGQQSTADRGHADPDELLHPEPQIVLEDLRHRRGGEAPDVIAVGDVQRSGLAAGQEQQAVVHRGQVRHREYQAPSGPHHPAHLAQGGHRVLQGNELTIPDHQIEVIVEGGPPRQLEIDLLHVSRGLDRRLTLVRPVVDDRAGWLGHLVPEEQYRGVGQGLDLQQAAAGGDQPLDDEGDLADHGQFDLLMPAFSYR